MVFQNFLYLIRKYLDKNAVVGLMFSTLLTFILPSQLLKIVLSIINLLVSIFVCSQVVYKLGREFNETISLEKNAQDAYRLTLSHSLLFVGGFWIPYFTILFFLNLRLFLINSFGNIVNINQILLVVSISLAIQLLSIVLLYRRKRLYERK